MPRVARCLRRGNSHGGIIFLLQVDAERRRRALRIRARCGREQQARDGAPVRKTTLKHGGGDGVLNPLRRVAQPIRPGWGWACTTACRTIRSTGSTNRCSSARYPGSDGSWTLLPPRLPPPPSCACQGGCDGLIDMVSRVSMPLASVMQSTGIGGTASRGHTPSHLREDGPPDVSGAKPMAAFFP